MNWRCCEESIKYGAYEGLYAEEMRILEFLSGGYENKEILLLGSGREPDNDIWSMNTVLTKMRAKVSAVDVHYEGPAELSGVKYYRGSANKLDELFPANGFDIVISTAMFGVPFTNWAIREYSLDLSNENFSEQIKAKELDALKQALRVTKPGGWQFHYNKDLNPQSWMFTRKDLIAIGCELAFQPEFLPHSRETWYLKKREA